jgi:ApaG protein
MTDPFQPVSCVTDGVRISVQILYIPEQSSPETQAYVFAYRITIRNESDCYVQLMRRRWYIVEALGEKRIVEGEGVVGQQPVLAPSEDYSYVSGCVMRQPIGQMSGFYTMVRLKDQFAFPVVIPAFALVIPPLNN